MGQSPSASRFTDGQGDALVRVENEDQTSKLASSHDNGDPFCEGGCFLAPFLRRGDHRAAFVTTAEEESPPELVLADVDDEEEDDDGDIDGKRLPNPGEEEEGPLKPNEKMAIPDDVLSRIVAVDCGMVRRPSPKKKRGGKKKKRFNNSEESTALRRVCVVNGYGHPLLSALVRVDDGTPPTSSAYYSTVARYLSNLLPKARRINGCGDDLDLGVLPEQVMEEASSLLRGKIVVGHSVGGDLAVLGLGRGASGDENFEVRDTATYAPFMREQTQGVPRMMSKKLSDLVRERLKREIQPIGKFHCCEEDAVAALDLYKSVWHEWEGCSKSKVVSTETTKGETTNTSEMQQQTKPKGGNVAGCQPLNSPTGQSTKVSQTKKKRKKKEKKRKQKEKDKNSREQKLAKPQSEMPSRKIVATTTWFNIIYTTVSHCNRLVSWMVTLICYPILLPLRISHDLTRLTRETISSAIRLVQLKCRGEQVIVVPQPFGWNRKKGAKKKRSWSWRLHQRLKQSNIYFVKLFLLCHTLLEATTIFSWLFSCGTSPGNCWDKSSMHTANEALALGLVGLNLLCRRRPLNNKGSKTLVNILVLYRVISFLLSVVDLERNFPILINLQKFLYGLAETGSLQKLQL